VTAVGNPRTTNLCSVLNPAAFLRYGDPGPPIMIDPTGCSIYLKPPGGTKSVALTTWVYGATSSDAGPGSTMRRVSDLPVDEYPFTQNYCRAMIEASGVAVGIQATDYTKQVPRTQVCSMRDLLTTQVASGISASHVGHVKYGPTSLTAVDVALSVKVPGTSSVKVKRPLESVVVVRCCPFSLFSRRTVAAATDAPLESVSVPESCPVVPCPNRLMKQPSKEKFNIHKATWRTDLCRHGMRLTLTPLLETIQT